MAWEMIKSKLYKYKIFFHPYQAIRYAPYAKATSKKID